MTAISTHRQPSDLTVTDVFCGAGGNTIGAKAAGMRVRVGLNHWERAIETYGTNNPEVDVVERVDVSLCDPRRYPSTDIAIMSPECTTHSPAGGNRHRKVPDLFDPTGPDEATVRSRVTMFDVIRFTEYHRYRIVIVENVVEATKWELFPDWLRMMDHLGYHHRIISANSMFFHPTPQSRDRIYIVFWERGNRAPNLDYTPTAPCAGCGNVQAVQAWKNGRSVGKYRRQYVYVCPRCAREVTPYYYAALNALDFSLPAERIGDKKLAPNTLKRVEYGLRTYGSRPLQISAGHGSGIAHRVRPVEDPTFTLVGSNCVALAGMTPFLYVARENVKARALDDPTPALVASANQIGIVQGAPEFTPFLDTRRTGSRGSALDEPTNTMCTGYHHALVQPAAIMRLMGDRPVKPLDDPLHSQTTGLAQNMLFSPAPFLVQYYGQGTASDCASPVPAVTTKDRNALISAAASDIAVEDAFHRMLEPHEIGAAMAFPASYRVTGKKGDRVKQYGNAVTPPVMDWIVRQCAATLHPELGEGAA